MNLQQLIESRRNGRPNHVLARDAGDVPGEGWWQKYASGQLVRRVPSAKIIEGVARALGVSLETARDAIGRSLVPGSGDAMSLPDPDQDPVIFSRVEFPDADLAEIVYIVAHVEHGKINTRTAVYMNEEGARGLLARMQWVLDGPKE